MKKKTGTYLVIGIVGIALALSARFLLQDCLSDSQSGAMIGIGAGLFGYLPLFSVCFTVLSPVFWYTALRRKPFG